jgi:hypothetical protein
VFPQQLDRFFELRSAEPELRGAAWVLGIDFLGCPDSETDLPSVPFGDGEECADFVQRVEIDAKPRDRKLGKPSLLGGAVDQEAVYRAVFVEGGPEFEFADHLDWSARMDPPGEESPERLGLERQEARSGEPEIERLDRRSPLQDRFR